MDKVYHCGYAERRPGKVLMLCKIQEDRAKGRRTCECGNQRYCPKARRTILTEGAEWCPVRKDYEKNKGMEQPLKKVGGGPKYAEF